MSDTARNSDPNSPQSSEYTGQTAFVRLVTSVLSTGEDAALLAYTRLRAFMANDSQIGRMYDQATSGSLGDNIETLFERVNNQVLSWNIGAIARQVIMPIAGGYVGYALAAIAGATAGTAVLIGVLVATVIWLAMWPGTRQMLEQRIKESLDTIFHPVFQ